MENDLIKLKIALTPQELEVFKSEIDRKRKSPILAYVLWFFLSPVAVHKFYLGKIISGFLFLVGPWTAIVAFLRDTMYFGNIKADNKDGLMIFLGFLGLISFSIWWLIDLFTLHTQTEKANEQIEKDLLFKIKAQAQ